MGHYTNKCLNEINKALFTNGTVPGWQSPYSWSVCLSSLSPPLPSSPMPQQELLKPWQVRTPPPLYVLPPPRPSPHPPATCCSFGSARSCLCLLIGGLRRSVHLFIFTWMARYGAIFLSGAAVHSRRRSTVFIFKSQINSPPHVVADFAF